VIVVVHHHEVTGIMIVLTMAFVLSVKNIVSLLRRTKMSKKAWKYFHEGDKFMNIIDWFVDIMSFYEEQKDVTKINKKIKITIDIFDDED
jgi:hypothetical protein